MSSLAYLAARAPRAAAEARGAETLSKALASLARPERSAPALAGWATVLARNYAPDGPDDASGSEEAIHQVPWVRSVMTGNELIRNPRYNKVSVRRALASPRVAFAPGT